MPRWRVAPLVCWALLVFRAPEGPATVWLCCCVAPRVFRAPEAPAAVRAGGRRPAREPSAPRAFGSARRLEARPGPAAAHRHRGRSLRRPPHQWGLVCWRGAGASPRSPARPRHRPPAPRQIPPAPSTPVGPGVLRSGLARCLAIRPGPASAQGCRRQALDPRRGCLCRSHSGAFGYALLQTSSIGGVFRVDFCVVVTNVVNPTAFSLKIKVFGRRLTTFVT